MKEVKRDQLLDLARQTEFPSVFVKELGGKVYIRKLTGRGRDRYMAAMARNTGTMSSELIVDCVCYSDGKRMFGIDDIEVVSQMPHRVIGDLVDAIDENNAIGPAEDAVEEAEKNSDGTQSG